MTDLEDAQREVDELLPGTPRIGPEPPLELVGCVEVPVDEASWSPFDWFAIVQAVSAVLLIGSMLTVPIMVICDQISDSRRLRDDVDLLGAEVHSLRVSRHKLAIEAEMLDAKVRAIVDELAERRGDAVERKTRR